MTRPGLCYRHANGGSPILWRECPACRSEVGRSLNKDPLTGHGPLPPAQLERDASGWIDLTPPQEERETEFQAPDEPNPWGDA